MKNSTQVQELEEQIAVDKQRYAEIERLEDKLNEGIHLHGFRDVSTELAYRGEEESLATSIRKGEGMIAGVRDHRDSSENLQVAERDADVSHSDIAVAAYYIWLERKDKTDDSNQSQTPESDWAQAIGDLLARE